MNEQNLRNHFNAIGKAVNAILDETCSILIELRTNSGDSGSDAPEAAAGGRISPRQVKLLRKIASERNWDWEEFGKKVQQRFNRTAAYLSKKQASELIQELLESKEAVMVVLPAEQQVDDTIHVSASSVRSIIEGCPREAFYRYVAGYEPQDRSSGLVLGSAVHEALALFYLTLKQSRQEAALEDMVAVAHATIDAAENVNVKEGEEDMKVTATRLLEAFVEHGYRPRGRMLAVEERFSIPLYDPDTGEVLPRLVGFFDLVEELHDGTIVVTDHKTAARYDKAKGEAQDLQMALYAHAARQIYGVERVELQFQSLVKTKTAKVVVQPLVTQDVATALETVVSAVTHVNLALELDRPEVLMYRRPSWKCGGCGYRGRCGE